ncbi:HEAT repeat domain-containing protein [Salegentibacter sp. F188]|uniref:HEAT repeat domain-containing protein n=1 Tax=Autumnicola patrickiae TaxID=3075591 RepID=A0ABU3E0R1_9FLAO|nr:HEAT repeat domain-containing protein [Salegentibacter sp. F188]MDT0689588.1 HEAT repeat domain-containing protein [Salegentibacter sp. F188]
MNKSSSFCIHSNHKVVCLNIFFALILLSCGGDPVDIRIEEMDPDEAAKLAKNIEDIINPEIADGLTLKIWGVDSLVADPIGIDISDKGHLFYTRTNRQKNSEFDIRTHQDWETASISMQTIEDKREFLHTTLSPENSSKNEWLPDLNGDGSHDWKDMTVEKENVYRLEDVSGDGVADLSQLVVEDFNDEVTDVAGAVLINGDDLFVGVAPDLWRIKDSNGDGVADEKTSISHGYGVHIGFGGHGMSGLEMGPDGKIYWGIGDIGFNGKGPDGKKWKYPNRGVIVRANPDGSDFEVFAMGVRNTHEFVFDEYGNLISVDNDGDHPGEKERLVYIVNGSDTGWRINWQFGKYRDPDNNTYKVWMDEELFKPRFEGQAAYITPAIANYISGPSGMTYNPGTALGEKWKNTFFVAEFVGNPAQSGIHAFKLNPKGASFELGESEMVVKGILPTGMDFGPDGALYVADWLEGWDTKNHGRIWKLDNEKDASSPKRQLTKELLAADFSSVKETELGDFLKNPDMRVRQKAQFELAKRGSSGIEEFKESITQKGNQLARVHGIWGISQLAREDKKYARLLLPLLKDEDPEIRAQAAKWLGDIRYEEAGDQLLPLLKDTYSRARFFAAEALGRISYEPAIQPIIELLQTNNDEDAYIRHAASLALARIGKADPVVALSYHISPAVRMGAVLALRRLSHPGIANFLDDEDEFIVTEVARAINDDYSIEEALPALGNVLQRTKFSNEPLIRRAINANLRVGTEEAMYNLINYSQKTNAPVAMKAEAVQALSTWAKPSVLDRVDGRYRGVTERNPSLIKKEAAEPLIKLLGHSDKSLRISAVQAIAKLNIKKGSSHLFDLLQKDGEPDVRVAALTALAMMQEENLDKAIQQAISDSEKSVRIKGLELLATQEVSEELTASLLAEIIKKRSSEEKQAAVLTLGSLPVEYSGDIFGDLLDQMEQGELAPEIHLELADAIERTHSEILESRYESIRIDMESESMLSSFEGSLFGGDEQEGERLFFQHQTAQCMKCHSFDDFGGNAGPRINGVAGRLSRQQILEALINPSKELAPGYGIVSVDLKNGKNITGVLEAENDMSLAIKMGNKPDTVVTKQDIVNRKNSPSSMPDMRNFLTKREIRDLVSYLATLKEDEMNVEKSQEELFTHGE